MGLWDRIKRYIPRRKTPTPPTIVSPRAEGTPAPTQKQTAIVVEKSRVKDSSKLPSNVRVVSRGGGSSSPAQQQQTYSTTGDTGTGYNPATRVQEGSTQQPIQRTTISASTSNVPQQEYNLYKEMSAKEKTGSVFGKITSASLWRTAGQQLTGTGVYQSPSPFKAIGTLASPFQAYFPSKKGDAIEIPEQTLRGGTMMYDNTGKGHAQVLVPETTKFEKMQQDALFDPTLNVPANVKQERLYTGISDDLIVKYQGQADAGMDIEKVNKDYKIEVDTQYKEQLSSLNMGGSAQFKKKYGELSEYSTNVPVIASTTAGLGLSVVAPVTAGALFMAEGQSMGYEGISEKNYLKAGLGFGLSTVGTYGGVRTIANQVTALKIADLTGKQIQLNYGGRIMKNGVAFDIFKHDYSIGHSKLTQEGFMKSSMIKGTTDKFQTIGTLKTRALTTDFYTGKQIIVGSGQSLSGSGTIIPISKKLGYAPATTIKANTDFTYSLVGTPKGWTGGAKIFTPTGESSKGVFGGITVVDKTLTKSFTGKLGSTTVDVSKYAISNLQSQFPVTDVTFLKHIKPATSSVVFSTSGGTALKTSSAFSPASLIPEVNTLKLSQGTFTKLGSVSTSGSKGFIQGSLSTGSMSLPLLQGMKVPTITKTDTKQSFKTKQITKFIPEFDSGVVADPVVKFVPATGSRVSTKIKPIIKPIVEPIINVVPPVSGRGFTPALPKPIVPIVPFIPFFNFGGGTPKVLKGIKLSGTKAKRYTPSFESFVFNIKGSKPTGREMGIRTRPITKGFTFGTKLPKFNFNFGVNPIKKRKKRRKK